MPTIAPEDRNLALFTTVLTNLSLLPAVFHAAREIQVSVRRVHLIPVGLSRSPRARLLASPDEETLGPLCNISDDFYDISPLSLRREMNPGSWHRLDTVCSILCFQTLAIYFADLKHRHDEEGLRWALLMIALWCQERSPWEVEYTVIPIAISFLFTIGKILYANELPHLNGNIRWAALWGTVAIYFFFVGLDDRNDWIRINHGLWHTFAGLGIHYALKSKEHDVDIIKSATHKI